MVVCYSVCKIVMYINCLTAGVRVGASRLTINPAAGGEDDEDSEEDFRTNEPVGKCVHVIEYVIISFVLCKSLVLHSSLSLKVNNKLVY